jgi:hypothetical protein
MHSTGDGGTCGGIGDVSCVLHVSRDLLGGGGCRNRSFTDQMYVWHAYPLEHLLERR